MEYSIIIFKQLLLMLIYMLIGFTLYKTGLLNKEGTKSLSNILIYVIMPCIVVRSCLMSFSMEGLKSLGEGFLMSTVCLLISFAVCRVVFKKDPLTMVGTTFPNAGFIGIPLVNAAFGSEAVFYLIPFQMMVAVTQYTYAEKVLSKNNKAFYKNLMKNPLIISAIVGVLLYVLRLGDKMPELINSTVNGIFNAQTPLAMIVTGTYLAQINFKHLNYKNDLTASFIKLIAVPLICFGVTRFLPINQMTKAVTMIAASTSIGSNVSVYAEKFGGDYVGACEVSTFSTILSIVTLPIMMMIIL